MAPTLLHFKDAWLVGVSLHYFHKFADGELLWIVCDAVSEFIYCKFAEARLFGTQVEHLGFGRPGVVGDQLDEGWVSGSKIGDVLRRVAAGDADVDVGRASGAELGDAVV